MEETNAFYPLQIVPSLQVQLKAEVASTFAKALEVPVHKLQLLRLQLTTLRHNLTQDQDQEELSSLT